MSKTIYYACKYAPLELFAGYGATFSALDPLAESFSCAERCAHANLCGYAKAVLEQVEQSGIRALVLTNCCDAMLRVYDVLAASGKMEFLQLLPVPHQSTPATRARFARDLRRLADALQRYTGQEFDAQRAHAFFVHTPHAEGPHLTLLGAHGGSVLYDTVQKAFALPVVDATCTGNRELADVAPAALEDCGLRGFRVGGAAISEKHCGFVVNLGNATCADVVSLTEQVRQIVLEKTGCTLEREIRVVE